MTKSTWTLTDVDHDVFVNKITLTPDDLEGAARGYSVTKRTLRGGLRDGVDVIEVDNGTFRFTVIPTRGMGLWRAQLDDLRLGWQSPVRGPVHPAFVPLAEAGGLGWLDGFDELLVRCGLESNGAPEFHDNGNLRYPLHGKIANRPAHKVEVTIDGNEGEISVTGVVDESRLFFNKLRLTTTITTKVGQPGLNVVDTVTNLSATPGEMELLYHINFGIPLLDPGSKLAAPVRRVAPRDAVAAAGVDGWNVYPPEAPGEPEQCFYFDLVAGDDGWTKVVLHNAAVNQGVGLAFQKKQLPCFTQWKNFSAAVDGYVTGLEPATNFPNNRSFEKEQGRVVALEPGESRSFEFALEAYPHGGAVGEALQAVERLQTGVEPEIVRAPVAEWAP